MGDLFVPTRKDLVHFGHAGFAWLPAILGAGMAEITGFRAGRHAAVLLVGAVVQVAHLRANVAAGHWRQTRLKTTSFRRELAWFTSLATRAIF